MADDTRAEQAGNDEIMSKGLMPDRPIEGMGGLNIHHIGYLVKNMEKAKDLFRLMGYAEEGGAVYDDWRDVDICFLLKDGYRIELVAPRGKNTAVGELRKKIGNSPYHICYEVYDLDKAISACGKEHFVIWQEPHEAAALDRRRVAFLLNGQMGMVELLEVGDKGNGI